ncbi:protein tyrosine phosphatase family protein [Anabaena sphaerica FACHB-251]|uniref:Protein tyrosine phosphatase family protein n=1 Tax=Anabaena sphaerica FACHB-251 TaxID=2692883 RepID=A0A926WFK7_9NOST|nr:protein tyrosine phosphatase family protein [Anabaena sphaerica]MBD2292934.1 protein tyrosine phosphatase family protein [Anabaena sphaerica FACHB-251]
MSRNGLEDIYNFLQISNLIATSGQPTAEQFTAIKETGYQLIINLALPTSPNSLPDEQEILESQGMKYINIPVVWENPTVDNVTEFFSIMEANANQKIFIHCIANKRVSVFMYLYRRLCIGISHAEAKLSLSQVWIPNQIWNEFIEEVIENYQSSI